jgi:hypothetical protein
MAAAPNRPLVDRHAGARQYFRRWNKIEKWKWLLTGVAGVVALAWLAAAPIAARLGRPNTDERYSHGPLANPHAPWEANCEVCHRPRSPGDDGWNVLNAGSRWRDLTCETCHAGPPHHATVRWPDGENDNCASCHLDHRGRNFSLTRIPDAHCTKCHGDLPKYHRVEESRDGAYEAQVTNFVNAHPEFRVLKDEVSGKSHPRTIKFSHGLHMAPGLSLASEPKNDRSALKDLPDYVDSARKENGLVQLTCATCHVLDAGRDRTERLYNRWRGPQEADWVKGQHLPSRAAGAVFSPVNFEAHCRSCHPLGRAGEGKDGLPGFEIPHGKHSREIHRLVEAAVALELGLGKAPTEATAVPFRRQQPERPAPGNPNAARFDAVVEGRYKIVNANCQKCHDAELLSEEAGRREAILAPNQKNYLITTPVRIPTVWFESARFDHTSHRGTDCKVCHPMPQIDSGKLDEREKINILGIASCRQCHAPAGGTRDAPTGGIRHGCTDCHTYHNGGHGLQGRGAAARVPAQPKPSAVEFLLGKPPPPREKP